MSVNRLAASVPVHAYVAPVGSFVTEQFSVISAAASYTSLSVHVTTGAGVGVSLTVTVTVAVPSSALSAEAVTVYV